MDMMSYLRMYRDKFVESNDLEYIYMNQSLKFVDYMEQIGLGDRKELLIIFLIKLQIMMLLGMRLL